VSRQRRRRGRQGVGRSTGLGSERKKGEVSDYTGDIGVRVKDGVVCLEGSMVSLIDIVRLEAVVMQ
jgi:hypothetical protein